MCSGRQHDVPDLRMQEHLDLAQPGSGSVRGGPDFCASSIFHGLPQSHTHPHSPRLEGVPPKTSTEYNMELPPGEIWEKNVDALRLVVCPTHTHFLTGGCWAVSTHMRGGGSIIAPRIADCLIGRRRGQNELAARMK